MANLLATFDDDAALERALERLDDIGEGVTIRVIDRFAHKDEQPLPPEVGAGSWVPVATPTAVTGHDVAPGDDETHPEGMYAFTFEELVVKTGMDQESAEWYRGVVARGGALLLIEGSDEQLQAAEALLRASRAGAVGRY